MDTNKMRAQYIEWLKTQPHVLNVGFNESTGKFVLAEDETAWQARQASRAAVVVELPSLSEGNRPYNQGVYDTKCRIEDQGEPMSAFVILGPLICFLGLLWNRREARQLEAERKRLRDLLREDRP